MNNGKWLSIFRNKSSRPIQHIFIWIGSSTKILDEFGFQLIRTWSMGKKCIHNEEIPGADFSQLAWSDLTSLKLRPRCRVCDWHLFQEYGNGILMTLTGPYESGWHVVLAGRRHLSPRAWNYEFFGTNIYKPNHLTNFCVPVIRASGAIR